MANLNDVEAKIQKIREQTQSIAQQVPGAVSVAQAKPAANNVEAIPVSSLQSPQSLIKLPQQKPDTTNYAGIINDGATLSKVYGAQDQQQGEMTASGLFDRYLGAMAANAPKDMSGDYEELNAGLEEKQNAVIASKKNLEMLNAQLQGITDTATAQNLAMEKQAATGGMNSPLFLSRQQAENSRQAAIASLPLQAKILAAQAQYNADNSTLLAAQDKVDKLFDIKSRYEERQQEYNQKLITSVFDYASDEQKAQLEAKAAGDKQAYEERQSKLKTAREYAKMAIQNGQGEVAGLLMELDASDPEFQSKLARYTSQIQDDSAALDRQYKQAQIAKIYGDMAGTPERGSSNDDYSRALQFVNDNPDATPQELEQNIRANTNLSEADIKSLVKTKSTLTRETISKMFKIEDNDKKSGFLGLWGETNKEKLDNIMNAITQYQNVGYNDQEILKMMQ